MSRMLTRRVLYSYQVPLCLQNRHASSSSLNSASSASSTSNPIKRKSRFTASDDGFTLEHFLIRSKVLALYRSFVRNTRGLGDLSSRHETIAWIRSEFEMNRYEKNLTKIKNLIASGNRQLKQIQNSTMLVGNQGERFRGTRKAT